MRHAAYEQGIRKSGSSIPEDLYWRYINKKSQDLFSLSKRIEFNRYQRATALAFYQRIYLKTSIWEFPPSIAIIVSCFFVSKFLRVIRFCDFLAHAEVPEDFIKQTSLEEILPAIELRFIALLDFRFKIHLPYNQFFAATENGFSDEEKTQILLHLNNLLMTDALFLQPPGVIAIAAIAREVGEERALPLAQDVDIRNGIQELLNLQFNPMITPEEDAQIEVETLQKFAMIWTEENEKEKRGPSFRVGE